jgi:hypothetical protein
MQAPLPQLDQVVLSAREADPGAAVATVDAIDCLAADLQLRATHVIWAQMPPGQLGRPATTSLLVRRARVLATE